MNDELINQAILESKPIDSPEPIETPTEAPEGNAPAEAVEPVDVPFPKKAVNALSRRDKQIGKLQAQLAADRAELAKYREQQVKSPTDNFPKEESFDNYGEYLKAIARHEAKQELSQSTKEQENKATTAQQEAWLAERESHTIERSKVAMETIPDYKQLFMENADILQSLPPHLADAFMHLDAPDMAFYALAKEGKLDALLDMSPMRAIAELGKAEVRGEALSKARPVTKAPTPIEGLKGTGSSNRTVDNMSHEQLMAWFRKK